MKSLICVISFLFVLTSAAQQDAIYSQYMFNPFAINPGYAGSRDAVSTVVLNRSQWVGIKGAPITQTLATHVPMNSKNLAWGVNLSHDQLGPTRNIFGAVTAAYQLKLDRGKLAFGLRGGIFNTSVDHGQLVFRENGDALDTKERLSSLVPTFDFGTYFYTERFYAGISVNHLTKHRFKFDQIENSDTYYLRRHIFLMTGYVFELNNLILLKPSILLKHTQYAPINADFNLNVMFNQLFWIGAGLRNFSSLLFLVDFNITDYLRIGYAYDMGLNKIKNYMNGSHEILVGFDFNLKKNTMASPRYL